MSPDLDRLRRKPSPTFGPRCWRLDKAPADYPTKVGTITQFMRDGQPPRMAWCQDSLDFVSLQWTLVPNPKDFTREQWATLMRVEDAPPVTADNEGPVVLR